MYEIRINTSEGLRVIATLSDLGLAERIARRVGGSIGIRHSARVKNDPKILGTEIHQPALLETTLLHPASLAVT